MNTATSNTGDNATSVSLALAGSGGAGVMTAGNMLLEAAALAGYFGLMTRTSGPQIRGGEAAAMLRIATYAVDGPDDRFDALIAVDWLNITRFSAEIPLDADSLLIGDPAQGAAPEALLESGAQSVSVEFKTLAKSIKSGWPNMVALGLLAGFAGLPQDAVEAAIAKSMKKGGDALAASIAAMHLGLSAAQKLPRRRRSAVQALDTGTGR